MTGRDVEAARGNPPFRQQLDAETERPEDEKTESHERPGGDGALLVKGGAYSHFPLAASIAARAVFQSSFAISSPASRP